MIARPIASCQYQPHHKRCTLDGPYLLLNSGMEAAGRGAVSFCPISYPSNVRMG